MIFIRPVPITEAMLTAASVAETDYPVWSSASSYAVGDRVIVTTGVHKVFQAVQAMTSGAGAKDPTVAANVPAYWLAVSATNRWKAFDDKVGTSTVASGTSLSFTLVPGQICDSIALLDISGGTVQVQVTDGAGGAVVYDKTTSLDAGNTVMDWYMYFFEPIVRRSALILTDLPPYASANIIVTITDTGGNPSLGTCQVGRQFFVGDTLKSTKVGIVDYSLKTTDAFGATSVTPRTFARRMEVPLSLQSVNVDETVRQLALYRATPCVWVADSDFDSMAVFGFYEDFSIDVQMKRGLSACTLTIKGLS